MAKTETVLEELKINYLSEEQYKNAVAAGEVNQDEIYMTPSKSVPTKTSELENDSGFLTEQDISGKLDKTGDGSNVTAAFSAASSRTNISTGEKLSVLFGKIAKWFSDLGSLAFKSTVAKSDLESSVTSELDAAYTHSQSAHAPSNAQENVIESIKVNGTEQTVTDKAVDITVPEPDLSGYLPLSGGTMTGNINVRSSDNSYYGWVGASGLQLYNAYDPNNATTLFRINPYYNNSPRVYFKLPTSAEGYFLSFYKGPSLEVFSVRLDGSIKIQQADGYYINLQANRIYPYEQLITTGSNPLALGCSYLNMKNKIIKNIGDPENDTDAANKKYVDDTISAHSGDTTIHVTADEKSAWNGKANASDMPTITLHKWTEVV